MKQPVNKMARVIGRESDLNALRSANESTSGVLVVGPPGVGKTYLVRSFLEEIETQGGNVERFVASSTTQPVPLGALSPVLAPADVARSSAIEQLTQATCSILSNTEGPDRPALMFDDVDLLDPASADVISQLVSTRKASVWMTVRSGESIPAPIEALWRSGDIDRIDLAPANRKDATEIAEDMLGGPLAPPAADALWDLTLGLPLYLREAVIDATTSGVLHHTDTGWKLTGALEPGARVQDLLTRRLERLGSGDRHLVDLVSLAEPVATILLTKVQQDAIIPLIRRGLLQWCDTKSREAIVIGHPLLAGCARGAMSPAHAGGLLGSLATSAASVDSVPYGTNLGLALAAQAVGAIVPATTLVAAAREALATFDPATALTIATSAVANDPEHAESQHVLGQILQMNGDAEGADRHLTVAFALSTDDSCIAAIANRLSHLFAYSRSDPRAAVHVLQQAAARLESPLARLAISVETAVVAALLGRFPEVLETGYAVLDAKDVDGDTRSATLGHVCYAQAMLVELDRFDSDWADALVLATPERLANRPFELDLLWALKGAVSMERGDFVQGLHELETHLERCEASNQYRGVAELIRAHMLIATGDGASLEAIESSLDQLRDMDPFNTTTLSRAAGGLAAALAGDPEAAARYLDGLRFDEVAEDPRATAWLGRALAAQAAASGDIDQAAAIAATAGFEAVKRTHMGWGSLALYDVVGYGRPGIVAEELTAAVGGCGAPFMELLARHANAAVAGDPAELRSIAHEFSSLGAALHAGRAWLDVAANDHHEVRYKLAVVSAQLIAADTALNQWFVWAGVDPVLSPREVAVAKAAVAGDSSKDIADKSFVSVRTVDNHLGRIYRTLELSGRAEMIETFRPSQSS